MTEAILIGFLTVLTLITAVEVFLTGHIDRPRRAALRAAEQAAE